MANIVNTGYVQPKAPKIARAAAGQDPFGLASGTAGIFGLPNRGNTGSASAAYQGVTTAGPSQPTSYGAGVPKPPSAATIQVAQQPAAAPTATAPTYDINTDPAYQATTSLLGQSDEQAKAAAQKQIRDYLLAYGDPNLASSLGFGDLAQAAANNPTSTVHQLKDQYTQGLDTLDQQLNQQNLTYSGYRVKQEKQALQNYQNALAQAAAGINSNLDAVNGNLSAALQQNLAQRIQAAQDAANRGYQAGGYTTSGDTTTGADGGAQVPNVGTTLMYDAAAPGPNSPLALARAAAGRGAILF